MIAPITGKLRKKIWLDLSVGIGLGVTSAYGFWYVATQSYRCPHAHVRWLGMAGICAKVRQRMHTVLGQNSLLIPFSVAVQEEFYLKMERQNQIQGQ